MPWSFTAMTLATKHASGWSHPTVWAGGDMQQRSEGLLQAGDWEVPAEDAACPTLNSAAAP